MGNKLSVFSSSSSHEHSRSLASGPVQDESSLLMPDRWMEVDIFYEEISSLRERLEQKDLGRILRTVSKFVPCQVPSCKCKGWFYTGVMVDSYGWKNGVCIKSGCNHPLSDHMSHLVNATMADFTNLLGIVFDIINIKSTLDNESEKPKLERNTVLEEIFVSIYRELKYCIHLQSFNSFDVNKIYGAPPFEATNIDQILINFCMYKFGGTSELKRAFTTTKFVLRYFDTWVWTTPKELPNCNLRQYSNSYFHYYRRYMVFCCLPRCVHSISQRYRPSKIFGQDVLKYTLKIFRTRLEDWCLQQSCTWINDTKFYCLDLLPLYLNFLETEVYAVRSPLWNLNYEFSDLKKKIDSELVEKV